MNAASALIIAGALMCCTGVFIEIFHGEGLGLAVWGVVLTIWGVVM